MKAYTVEEIINFYNMYQESSKESKQTYLQKSSTYRKLSSYVGSNSNNPHSFMNFLGLHQEGSASSVPNTNPLHKPFISRKSILNPSIYSNLKGHNNYVNSTQFSNKGDLTNSMNAKNNINNNNLISNSSSTMFNVKLKNFSEMMNKAIKEGVGTVQNTVQNIVQGTVQNTNTGSSHSQVGSNTVFGSGGKSHSLGINYTPVHNPNTTGNFFINLINELNSNKNPRKTIVNGINNPGLNNLISMSNSYVIDLVSFFQENGLNFQNFCDVLQYIQNNFLKNEKFTMRYQVMLIKVNRSNNINRVPVTVYDINLTPRSYFLIVEAEEAKLKTFFEDKKFVMENMQKYLGSEEKELMQFITKKISDLSEKIEKVYASSNNVNDLLLEQEKSNKLMAERNATKLLFKCKVTRLLPEGVQHGVFLILRSSNKDSTGVVNQNNSYTTFVEFRPVTNNYKGSSFRFKLHRIEAIVPYRYLYKNRGLNIFLYQSKRSKIFVFDNDNDFQYVNNFVQSNSANLNRSYNDVHYHTQLWTNGLMSNYDYLLYLNFMGSRSFSDLSQYPIFPWVITNYEDSEEEFDMSEERNYRDLSKPIGAVNPDKFEKFNKKYVEMCFNYSSSEPPYFYGTHYSNPAYVIYFLTRAFPQFQLQIQNGSYGPADRMFNSLKDCWNYIYSSTMGNEVMELIPEFYHSSGEFLMNIHNIQLGKPKNSEVRLNDVELPKWAKSHKDFINICRAALESEYVSSSINNWIDLIFGYKQRGKDAEANDNLFYHITYDTYNYDEFPDDKKGATITQILQFGQTPRQLFFEPHPKKKSFDMLYYQLTSTNPKEITDSIEKYRKENEKLENNYKRMVDSKFMEKQRLINEYKEIEKWRTDNIQKLKEYVFILFLLLF